MNSSSSNKQYRMGAHKLWRSTEHHKGKAEKRMWEEFLWKGVVGVKETGKDDGNDNQNEGLCVRAIVQGHFPFKGKLP